MNLKGSKLASKGKIITLSSPNLQDENTFDSPQKISPKETDYKMKGENAELKLLAYSVNILKLKVKQTTVCYCIIKLYVFLIK
nr:alpha-L-arabinofuranosidase C-terminal domain-containing protein [Flavobacterium fluviatile]